MTSNRPVALITGASSGLGFEFACQLAEDDHDLVLVARGDGALRRQARELEANHGILAMPVAIDLSRPGAAEELWRRIAATTRGVNVLINSAGIGVAETFAYSDPDTTQAMLELNINALTTLTRKALPGMLERRYGRILNVSSVAGYRAGGR